MKLLNMTMTTRVIGLSVLTLKMIYQHTY